MNTIPARTALVTGGAKRIGRAIVEDLAANGFAVAIHANSSMRKAESLAARHPGEGGKAAALSADLTRIDETERLVAAAVEAVGPLGPARQQRVALQGRRRDGLRGREVGPPISRCMRRAPVILTQKFARPLRRPARTRRQHHRRKGLAADAEGLFLYAVEIDALDRDAHARAGAGAGHTRQRHRPGTDPAERAADRGGVQAAVVAGAARRRARPRRIRPNDPLPFRDAVRHGPDDRARRRAAPRVALTRQHRYRRMTGKSSTSGARRER